METTFIATKPKVTNKKIKDGPKRKRTGNGKTDLACTGRERLENPKDLESKNKYENCQVCGRSFKKGRGLNIHMSATTCRKIFERRNRIDKSNSGTTQESNHSGGTAKHSEPHQSLIKNEPERPEAVNEAKTNDILVIDDDIEESIRKEVLTLPQCVEMKVRDIRTNGERAEERRNIVVLKDASRNPLKKADG